MRRIASTAALIGLGLVLAACGDGPATEAATSTTEAASITTTTAGATTATTAETTTTSAAPDTTAAPESTVAGSGGSGGSADEGQDTPTINGWQLEVESQPCEESDLPGSPGGEAVVPASWAAGNADHVQFVVDGDLRPANLFRDPTGPGNIQVPCDPSLNGGHEITMVAYTGSPGDKSGETTSETLIVITTATVDNGGENDGVAEATADLSGEWVLVSMGPDDAQTPVSTDKRTTLVFADGELRGQAPCNRYRAPYTLRGSGFSTRQVAATRALCGDPDLDRQEADYLLALETATGASIEGGTLVITFDGSNQLRYRRV